MCGIVGQVKLDGSPADRSLVERMRDLEVHRGPDGAGIWWGGPAALGHRRLSIIDLSDHASQPMSNEDGTVVVTFNGEIYNFQELRSQLLSKGHHFKSDSDTEVLVHLYEEMGERLVDRLRGMFAFAIWDSRKQSLLLARDRVGKKPLFYRESTHSFEFASEVRSLLASLGHAPRPNRLAIHHYLTYQYVPSPQSSFEGIRKLPPAHVLVLEPDGHVRTTRYWRPDYRKKTPACEEEATEILVPVLRDAVRLRMISDVPLGAFLSGGVDSGLVVALMAEQSSQPVKTFSIGFSDQQFNELPYARQVAERYGTDHTEYFVEPSAIDILPRMVRHYGEPFADSSALPSFYLAELTRQSVTVALNGDGGDESFGGYTRYVTGAKYRGFGAIPEPVRTAARSIVPLELLSWHTPLSRKMRRMAEMALTGGYLRYVDSMSYFLPDEKQRLYAPEFLAEVGEVNSNDLLFDRFRQVLATDWTDRLLAVDVETYLPDDLLVKVDIATMASSLEARSPLLDHVVMEHAARLPVDLKVRNGETKYLLKRIAERYLPAEVIYRPKQGFAIPLSDWFREPLADYTKDVLLDDSSLQRGYFRPHEVERLIDDHVSGRAENASKLWALVCLELWHREFIDAPNPPQ